jgi:hypothetical protein
MPTHAALIHPETGQINVARLAEEVTAIRDRVIDERLRLESDCPHVRPEFDVRITSLGKLQNVLTSFQLGCAFWAMDLMSPEWWDKMTDYPEAERTLLRSEWQMFLKLGLVHFSFSAVESSLRAVMRTIEPTAHAGSTLEFKRLYDDLLLHRLSAPRPAHVELLDMAAKIRNTVHNNGIYFHKSGSAVDQPYKGRTFRFVHGKSPAVGGWPLLLELTADLVSMLVDVSRDPRIMAIRTEILDPGAA